MMGDYELKKKKIDELINGVLLATINDIFDSIIFFSVPVEIISEETHHAFVDTVLQTYLCNQICILQN